MPDDSLKAIVEAALAAAGGALSVERILELFDDTDRPDPEAVEQALLTLQTEYRDRGLELVEIASGYRLQVPRRYAPWISRLWDEKPARYSRALMETLALIVYRQPITRPEIEDIRGVAVTSHIIKTLLEREWVRVIGHRETPGRPALYATSRVFLDEFGLKSLDQLPKLSASDPLPSLAPTEIPMPLALDQGI